MIIPLLLIILAAFQAALRSSVLPLTLIYAAFFSFALLATKLDFTHSLLINSIFCLFLAQYCAKKYDSVLSGGYIAVQFIAVVNYLCMGVAFAFFDKFYDSAITLYNSLNDTLIVFNFALLLGMSNGASGACGHN